MQSQGNLGRSLLVRAIIESDIDHVALWLQEGGDPNQAIWDSGMTALMFAADQGRVSVVKALLQASANPNLQAKDGSTALMYAVVSPSLEIVVDLIKAGADVNVENKVGMTALKLATERVRTVFPGVDLWHVQITSFLIALAEALRSLFKRSRPHSAVAEVLIHSGAVK